MGVRGLINRWRNFEPSGKYIGPLYVSGMLETAKGCADALEKELPDWTKITGEFDEDIPHDWIMLAYVIAGLWVRTVIPSHQIPEDLHSIDYWWRPLCDLDKP